MNGIYWLASYPKSGNTWLRIFLNNLLSDKDEPIDINNFDISIPIASDSRLFDKWVGYQSSLLAEEEIENLRPDFYNFVSDRNLNNYIKIHDAYLQLANGKKLIPKEGTRGVVYIVRNPLDITVSIANHMSVSIDLAVENLCDNGYCLMDVTHSASLQFTQKLLTWSEHVNSWTSQRDIKIHIIRYEDMLREPYKTFKGVVDFLGLSDKQDRLQKAIEFSDFKIVKQQELDSGFKERPFYTEAFFREGKVSSWKKYLTDEHVKKIIANHRDVMVKFGYLTDDGELID